MACFGCVALAAAQPAPNPAVPAVPDAEKIVIPRGSVCWGVPLDIILNEFSQLTERTIIAPANLPRITFNFKLNNDLSFNEAVEFYQVLLAVNGISIKLQGNQYAIEWKPKAEAKELSKEIIKKNSKLIKKKE